MVDPLDDDPFFWSSPGDDPNSDIADQSKEGEKKPDLDLSSIDEVEYLGEDHEVNYFKRARESLKDLLTYPFIDKEYDGMHDRRYNSVERVDVVKDKTARIVRCPIKFMDVVKYITEIRGKTPGIGLKYKEGTSNRYVHLVLSDIKEGWIFIDSGRLLQVRDIHKIEKIRDRVGLKQISIIANQIGLPARHEVSRINMERGKILDLHHFDTIHNHKLTDYF